MTPPRLPPTSFVSILVPTHDNPEMLRQVVVGVLENTRVPFELIVLDNASSLPEVVSYLEEIATLPNVKVIHLPENRFYWSAINDGLRHCDQTCSWLVTLNDDCVILGPSWIERLISSFADRREVGFVGDLMSDSLFPPLPPLVDGYCTMFRRRIFDTLGEFDARYPFWWGFADFQLRARKRGILGADIKLAGDRHHFIAGVVHHLRGRTLAGIQPRMTPVDRNKLFGNSFTKARLLVKHGFYGHAMKLLIKQVVGAADGSSAPPLDVAIPATAPPHSSSGLMHRLFRRASHTWHLGAAWLRGDYSCDVIAIDWPSSPNRVDFLQSVATAAASRSYLEIGCYNDRCFSSIPAPHKVGVDPRMGGTVRTTSDAFFSSNTETFDLVFIDGLHVYEQVLRDIRNALRVLTPRGIVVVHDCLPLNWAAQHPREFVDRWNGDVWKAFVEVRTWPHVDAATCLIDHGLGLIVPRPNTDKLDLALPSFDALPFSMLVSDYPRLLRTLDIDAGLQFVLGNRGP